MPRAKAKPKGSGIWFASIVTTESVGEKRGWVYCFQAWGHSEAEALGDAVASSPHSHHIILRTTWEVEGLQAIPTVSADA